MLLQRATPISEFAEAMLGYFNDQATARRHARAARRVAESRFSLTRMVSDYASLYERELAAAGIPIPPASAGASSGMVGSAPTRSASR